MEIIGFVNGGISSAACNPMEMHAHIDHCIQHMNIIIIFNMSCRNCKRVASNRAGCATVQ